MPAFEIKTNEAQLSGQNGRSIKPACSIAHNYLASRVISSSQFSHDLLYSCPISTTFCLFDSEWHDTFKIANIFAEQGKKEITHDGGETCIHGFPVAQLAV